MDLSVYFESFKFHWPVLLLALLIAFAGNTWINYLYPKALQRNSLSFPDQIDKRAKWRKPLLLIALLFCFGKAWSQATIPALIYILIAVSFLLFMTITDYEQQVILNEMVFLFALFGLCYTLHLQLSIQEHLLAALGGGLLFLFLAFISRGALGGGDIKLIAALGLWLGVKALINVIIYGAIAGGIAALLLLFFKKTERKQYMAYGPYYTLSAIGILLKLLRLSF